MAEEKREELEVKQVLLEEIIDVTKKYLNGEFSDDEMNEYGQTLQIRGYIPLTQKITLIMALMNQYEYSDYNSQELRVADMYKNLFFHVILGGYAFIDCTNTELLTYENYDLLYPVFAPYILNFCKQDYDVFKAMVTDTINMYGINNFVEAVESVDITAMKEATQANGRFMTQLAQNKDLIEKINNIAAMNDPLTQAVVEELRKINVEKVLEKKSEE